MIRRYSELVTIASFEDRFNYVKLYGKVGEDTFGFDRYLNQLLYTSKEWRSLRNKVIIRDTINSQCLDLACEGHPIFGQIVVHHLNPITAKDILDRTEKVLNPDFLVCVSQLTHRAIHYGDVGLLPKDPIERKPNDTIPWRSE